MGFFDFSNNEDVRKRDYYRDLFDGLQRDITDYSNCLAEINRFRSSYRSKMCHASNGSIPSNDFEPKREQLDYKLDKYIASADEKIASLNAAKKAAYYRYVYYRDKVNAKEGK